MMNIIHIDETAHPLIEKWNVENKELQKDFVKNQKFYFNHCLIDFGDDIECHYTVKNNRVKWNCKEAKKQILKGDISVSKSGVNDFDVHYQICDENLSFEFAEKLAETVSNHYVVVNNIFFFGNVVDNNNMKIKGRSVNGDKHYFIREYNGTLYAVNSRCHRSPEGVFGVRGHFRKYKSGKIIWIDEYLKGIDKEK